MSSVQSVDTEGFQETMEKLRSSYRQRMRERRQSRATFRRQSAVAVTSGASVSGRMSVTSGPDLQLHHSHNSSSAAVAQPETRRISSTASHHRMLESSSGVLSRVGGSGGGALHRESTTIMMPTRTSGGQDHHHRRDSTVTIPSSATAARLGGHNHQHHRESVSTIMSSRRGSHRESVVVVQQTGRHHTSSSKRDSVFLNQLSESRVEGEATTTMAVIKASVRWRRSSSRSSNNSDDAFGCRRPLGCKPYIKFRRAARAVMLIQRVCRVCKDLVYEAVCSEEWYAKMDSVIQSSDPGFGNNHHKRVRPFRTLVSNEKKELIQLTFDRSEFYKERRVDLTEDMRELLNLKASDRTLEQNTEILRYLKRASPDFNTFPLESQKQMVQCMWFDTYLKDRVITKSGSGADSIFFVLSGKLVEKAKDRKHLREIKQGEGFGEEDLKCACPRRTTVLTQTTVELITIHRQDYRAILNMCDDSHDPRYLDICKQDLVFQHFPLHKLLDNPAVWTVLSYKFGTLMVQDSNEMEWIYIIKSGEARVIKHLAAGDFNIVARRKAIKERQNQESAYYRRKQIVDFVSDTDTSQRRRQAALTSAPAGLTLAQQRRRRIGMSTAMGGRYTSSEFSEWPEATSTPTGSTRHVVANGETTGGGGAEKRDRNSQEDRTHRDKGPPHHVSTQRAITMPMINSKMRPHTAADNNGRKAAFTLAGSRKARPSRPTTAAIQPPVEIHVEDYNNNPDNSVVSAANTSANADDSRLNDSSVTDQTIENAHNNSNGITTRALTPSLDTPAKGRYVSTSFQINGPGTESGEGRLPVRLPVVGSNTSAGTTPRTLNASSSKASSSTKIGGAHHMVKVPPFVQLESLNPGRVFGLRSCLEPEQRGPSASLVSGGCEVLQINKKFFMKHADEAILSLIKLKYKAFPSEEELMDRLDVNIRWEEYKQSTVLDFLRLKGRQATGYNTAFVSVS